MSEQNPEVINLLKQIRETVRRREVSKGLALMFTSVALIVFLWQQLDELREIKALLEKSSVSANVSSSSAPAIKVEDEKELLIDVD